MSLSLEDIDLFKMLSLLIFLPSRSQSITTLTWLYVLVNFLNRYSNNFTKFCNGLMAEAPDTCMWAASSQHQFIPPCLTEVKLTTSLRSPPVITKEVMKAKHIQDGNVHNYTASDIPVLSDGPEPKRIKHRDQQGHTGHWPDNCMECGRQIARVLSDLGIKPPGRSGILL